MLKIYKVKIYAWLIYYISYFFFPIGLCIILSFKLRKYFYITNIVIIIFASIIIFYAFSKLKMHIYITDRYITIFEKNKKTSYDLNKCSFNGYIRNNRYHELIITDEYKNVSYYNCSCFGHKEFIKLLEELKTSANKK